jgi:hypothetical protein
MIGNLFKELGNISPGHYSSENTLNTLRYSDRVKELKRKSMVELTHIVMFPDQN